MGKVKISDRFTGKSGVSTPSVKRALARNKATGSVNYGMFVDESEQDNQIYITLNNASETDTKRIVLFAGNLTTLDEVKKVAGLSNADAIAAEGKVAEDVTVGEIFDIIGQKRGFLLRGGEINYDRAAAVILDEFRAAKIGRITLDICPTGTEA